MAAQTLVPGGDAGSSTSRPGHFDQEIHHRLDGLGGTSLTDDHGKILVKRTPALPVYDYGLLVALKEILSNSALAECFHRRTKRWSPSRIGGA